MINRYAQRFEKAEVAVSSKQNKWRELDEFDRGEQWKNSSIPTWVPKPVTNLVRYIRTIKRANLASAIPKATFYPEYPEDAEVVTKLQKAYDHVWETKRLERTIRRSIDRALLQGTAIAYIYTDVNTIGGKYYGEEQASNQLYQGDVCVKRFPIGNFFPDPDAYDLDSCKWIETTEFQPLQVIRENPAFVKYAQENGHLDKLKNLNHDMLERTNSSSGELYIRDTTPTMNQKIQGDEMATLHTHWERYYKNGSWHLDVSYYLRNIDFFLLRLEDVKPSEYPFAVLYDEEEENDFWGTSTIMDILENQKIVNKLQQTAAILAVLHQNPQKVVWKESGINAQELAKTGTIPGKVWTSNVPGEQAISTIKPMDVPRGLFELDDRTQAGIKDIVGITEAYTGQSVGSLTTSTGVSSLIERSSIRDRDKMSQIDAFVERISHLIVLQILYKWEDERPITTIGPDGQPQFDQWEPIDTLTADNLVWRVSSDIYRKAPITQDSRRQQADKLLQLQGQFQYEIPVITPEEFIKLSDFDDAPAILQRMQEDRARLESEKSQNLSEMIMQASQQVQELLSQGVPQEEAVEQARQMIDEQLNQQTQQALQQGMPMPSEQQAPKGTTSQTAMSNMTSGTM